MSYCFLSLSFIPLDIFSWNGIQKYMSSCSSSVRGAISCIRSYHFFSFSRKCCTDLTITTTISWVNARGIEWKCEASHPDRRVEWTQRATRHLSIYFQKFWENGLALLCSLSFFFSSLRLALTYLWMDVQCTYSILRYCHLFASLFATINIVKKMWRFFSYSFRWKSIVKDSRW